jgi:hypothetical protein
VRSTKVFPSRSRSQHKEDSTTITFGLLREDHRRILECAYLLNKSISGICREALAQYLDSSKIVEETRVALEGGTVIPEDLNSPRSRTKG